MITRMILGGAQENTLLTVRGLHEDPDWDTILVTGPALGPEGELIEEARELGIKLLIIEQMRRAINPFRDLISFFKLWQNFRKNDYEIVHTHSSKAGIIGRWAAFLAGVPLIVHTIHGLPFHQYQARYKFWFYSFLEKITALITDKIITVCDRMTDQAKAVGVNPRQGYRTVYSGMKLEEFLAVPQPSSQSAQSLREKWGYHEKDFVIGKIARLFHLKGYKYFIEAFARVAREKPTARALIVGDGILREQLEEQAEKLGVRDKIQFAGLVPYSQIPEMLTVMDCLVHTSLREGLPRVIPQAQAAGRPVVSYAIDGAPEAIEDGKTGFLIEPREIEQLARSVSKLIDSAELRGQFAERAREWVVPRFHWQTMVKEIKKCYNQLLE